MSDNEAKSLLQRFGPNSLPENPPPTDFQVLLSQLKSPLVYVLLVAAIVTFSLGEYADTAIITVAIFINTILGFIQERRANKALSALRALVHPQSMVIRGGEQKKIAVENVVPGDICVLNQGDKIPADGILLFANRLFISEATLTGESLPVGKEEKESVYMGTIVTAGRGYMKVEKTGALTQIGKIATTVQSLGEETPLKREVASFSKQLSILTITLTIGVFAIGIVTGRDWVEMFKTSVALSVSAIPEGLLVGLTVVLAIGMQRILKRKGLVRSLVSAETLGGVSTICLDKTGTLTEGIMQVVDFEGKRDKLARQAILANDMDDPIVIAAHSWAINYASEESVKKSSTKIDSIPFSSKERFYASLNKDKDGEYELFVNGAPEFILDWSNISPQEKEAVIEQIEKYSKEGKRLVGYGYKTISNKPEKITDQLVKNGLTWIGILIYSDPIRKGIKNSFDTAMKAGIRPIVITGDYANTARAVMNEIGLEVEDEDIILGEDLDKWSSSKLAKKLSKGSPIILFARTTPEQKLIIVKALKENGEIVAMTGDGVNDAPALKAADIGIVVGDATDVAKESADLILLDSSFDTIIAAVEEGRGIFDNIRKIILYLMSDAFEEIVAVIGTIMLGLPLPITAAQILWINLISDGLPNLALTVDPKEKGIMDLPPRKAHEPLVAKWIKLIIAIVSITGGLIALGVYIYYLRTTGDIQFARSVAFATLGVNSLFYVFSIRTLHDSFWEENPFSNSWLNAAFVLGMFLQVLPFVVPALRAFLGLSIISYKEWMVVFGASTVMFFIIELVKDIATKKMNLRS